MAAQLTGARCLLNKPVSTKRCTIYVRANSEFKFSWGIDAHAATYMGVRQ